MGKGRKSLNSIYYRGNASFFKNNLHKIEQRMNSFPASAQVLPQFGMPELTIQQIPAWMKQLESINIVLNKLKLHMPTNVYSEASTTAFNKFSQIKERIEKKFQSLSLVELLEASSAANSARLILSRSLALTVTIAQTLKTLDKMICGLTILGLAYFGIRTLISGFYTGRGLWEGDDIVETLGSHGFDTLSNAIWTTAMILPFFTASVIAAPVLLLAFGWDIVSSGIQLSKKENKLEQEINSDNFKARSDKYKNTALQLDNHYQQARQVNIATSSLFFFNTSVLLAIQTCLKIGLLVGMASVAWPLTVACLTIALTATIAYAVYRYNYQRPKEIKLEEAMHLEKDNEQTIEKTKNKQPENAVTKNKLVPTNKTASQQQEAEKDNSPLRLGL